MHSAGTTCFTRSLVLVFSVFLNILLTVFKKTLLPTLLITDAIKISAVDIFYDT